MEYSQIFTCKNCDAAMNKNDADVDIIKKDDGSTVIDITFECECGCTMFAMIPTDELLRTD